mgnify:CR=1 FL=1
MNPARINTYHSSIRAMSERFEQSAQSEKSDQSMRSPHPYSDRENDKRGIREIFKLLRHRREIIAAHRNRANHVQK